MTTTATHPRRRARRGQGELLRGEILQAAKDLLADTGDVDAVSVRAVAQRVGVSTPSLYLHFADKSALIDAVCEDVFTALDRVMEDAAAEYSDSFEGLRARGMAYVRFAFANPEHYRLAMMRRPQDSGAAFSEEDIVASTTYHHLVEAVRACVDEGVFAPDTDVFVVATALWASTHGAVSLVLAKPAIGGAGALALCEHVISAAGIGLAVTSRLTALPADQVPETLRHMLATLTPVT